MTKNIDATYLAFIATQAVLKAGQILQQGFGTQYQVTAKPGRQNIVTEYDHASEKCIVEIIKEHFPSHTILAEEGGLSAEIDPENVLWLIDPLDGTSNFAHHIPFFCISISAHYQNKALFGIVYQPITRELFIAVKGEGSHLNGKQLQVSRINQLEEAIIHAGLPPKMTPHPALDMIQLERLNKTEATLRNMGSAALGMAYVAAGKLDGFWMHNLHPWDWAAGKILVEEAGGIVTPFSKAGEAYSQVSNIMASNTALHKTLLTFIK